MFTYVHGQEKFFKNSPADHENLSNNCDPHMYDFESHHGDFQGSYASSRRCLYNRDSFEYVF